MTSFNTLITSYTDDENAMLQTRLQREKDLYHWEQVDHFTAQEDIDYRNLRIQYLKEEIARIDLYFANRNQSIISILNDIMERVDGIEKRVGKLEQVVRQLSSLHI